MNTENIVNGIDPKPREFSFAVIDLTKTSEKPQVIGYNLDAFIYPASIWKVFVAAEVLRKAEGRIFNLEDKVKVVRQNKDDRLSGLIQIFPSGSKRDHRPEIKVGDEVTIDLLLDLMLTRSDNMASNALVSLVGLEDINEHIILANGWKGSEVSDAHVSKLKAQPTYQFSKVTVSTARHLAELFYLIETDRLVSVWVSERLKDYMHKWNRAGRTGLWIPEFEDYYRKGGWLEIVGPPAPTLRWINDAGVVKGPNSHYVVVVLTLTESVSSEVQFQIDSFSRKVFHHMETKSKV